MCVSHVFSLTLFTVLLDGQDMCVFLFKAPKHFFSDLLSSEYLFSSAIDESAPDDLRGVGFAGFFWFVLDVLPCSGSM